MTRRTKDPRLAAERLAEHLGADLVQIEDGGKLYRVEYPDGFNASPRTAKRCLALMILHATTAEDSGGHGMDDEEVADVCRLTRVPGRGLKAHESAAIARIVRDRNETR